MSVEDTISRPYARAIFETAIQTNSIEEWKNILIFINTIASYGKIKNFLSSSLSPKYLSTVFIEISRDIIDDNAINLIKLLAENKRFKILNNILEKFLKLEASYKNIIIIELISAFPLKEKEIKKIREKLEQYLLRKTKLICKVDPNIINGVIIKFNNMVVNLSVQNYLKQLSDALHS
ncbi:F0F1 ATP synthase subunit delta [Buchnera aphidicola (Hyperomyzus lactucae)]|uniref:ATP synthase subunit delta n=1 Tax=Buchnera aphidicola (Hyperomyzus lactucae) TaxID=1241860 RepID=A0A4D6XXI3_9GAMM|nr:F0F1 ATP synthase subunit delta [Buchnera aphidicola]QCI20757.1 F0F1 ATP synthase subunit delta [Buchnera aphidicola (Hyperomyzus lactucae)]